MAQDDFDIPWEDEVTQKAAAVINQNVDRFWDMRTLKGSKPTKGMSHLAKMPVESD